MRAFVLCCGAFIAAQTLDLAAQGESRQPLALLDVPFISQSELLCGGAAAAMVLRYWGERGIAAETFSHLIDRSAAGIRTDALIDELRRRGWTANSLDGDAATLRRELSRGRPVLTLIEDRPSTFHYIVPVAWHDRGVVFHDPARGPFVVMSTREFERRWRAARRWMAVVVPGKTSAEAPTDPKGGTAEALPAASLPPLSIQASGCEQAVAQGVRHAQSNELDAAERILAAAVGCPSAARELAGLRVLQKRWVEAEDLASTAVATDGQDAYAWRVLATSRFVQNDRLGALLAWNRAGEPLLDLVRVEGLTHTRHRVVEQLVGAPAGEVLTAGRFVRARRRLASLPSATSTRLDYLPVPKGLAELRAVVAERPLVPTGRLSLAAAGLVAATMRELRVATGALSGGGEEVSAAWRFWPGRMRVGAGVRAPAPWGGVWSIDAFSERQPFTAPELPAADRVGADVGVSDWLTGHLRWTVTAGLDAWAPEAARARVGGRVQFASLDDRLDAAFGVASWPGTDGFATVDAGIRARSTTTRRGVVMLGSANLQLATDLTPLDLWWAGDTGHARSAFLRAHPLLDKGRLRIDRLGRALGQASLEWQRWWPLVGPVSAAAAMFGDVARTGGRRDGPPRGDVDVGLGVRLAVAGISGAFSVDVAKGLADGATAFSVAYQP
ncbi:MAG: C39 family peptidase [Vicinamibacterales bacterium]